MGTTFLAHWEEPHFFKRFRFSALKLNSGLVQKLGKAGRNNRIPKKKCNEDTPMLQCTMGQSVIFFPIALYIHLRFFYSNKCNCIVYLKVYINQLRVVFFHYTVLARVPIRWKKVAHYAPLSPAYEIIKPVSNTRKLSLLTRKTFSFNLEKKNVCIFRKVTWQILRSVL